MKCLFSSLIILSLLLQPIVLFAQTGVPIVPTPPPNTTSPIVPRPVPIPATGYTRCPDGTVVPPRTACKNTASTNTVLGRFTPGLKSGTGDSNNFGGLSFSGVGGAVLGCVNAGGSLVSGVGNLFKTAEKKAKDIAATALLNKKSTPPSSGGGNGGEQPVTDAKVTEEMKKQTQRENCLNGVASAVAKNMLQQISTKTLKWINTGFNGNPLYVRDIDSYLKTIRDDKFQKFLQDIPNSNPVFGNALRSVIQTQVTGFDDGQLNKNMNTPEARSYQAFLDDFTQGGWDKWLQTTQIDSNNPIGALFQATDQISGQINNAQQNIKDQIQRNSGFLDMQKCVEYEKPSATSSVNQNGGYSALCATITPQNQAYCQSNAAQVTSGTQAKCLRYETVTPGSLLRDQVAYITNSPVRQLEYADQINEVLGSFFDEMLNRLFTGGLAGLSGQGSGQSVGMGSNIVIGTDGNPIAVEASSAQNVFGYQQVNGGFNGEFDISRPQQLRSIIQSQADYLNTSLDSQAVMSTIVPILGALDYCLPGPNPSWKVGTNYNMQLFTAALQGKPPSKTLGNTISSISSAAGSTVTGTVVGAPLGLVIGVVGNAVGQLINLWGGSSPKSLESKSLQLFDKVTNGAQGISDYSIQRQALGGIDLPAYIQSSYQLLIDSYNTLFNPETITNSFIAADTNNPLAYVKGRLNDIYRETNNLIYYNQSLSAYGKQYTDNIQTTEDAVYALSAINDEVQQIVSTAKARYIKEQKDLGTPVNLRCLNEAYTIDTTPILGVRREIDPNAPLDPMVEQSRKASDYFYNHL